MDFKNDDDRKRAYDIFAGMTWNDREQCGYTQPLMRYSHIMQDISSITEYTTRKAYDGAKKSMTITMILMYVAIGGALALVSTALAQSSGILPWDGNALEYVLIGTLLAIVSYMLYALKRAFASTLSIYESNVKEFETPSELTARMRNDVKSDANEAKFEKEEHAEIDELKSLIGDVPCQPSFFPPVSQMDDEKDAKEASTGCASADSDSNDDKNSCSSDSEDGDSAAVADVNANDGESNREAASGAGSDD